eukprot:1628642-Rhodomonas_salina.2
MRVGEVTVLMEWIFKPILRGELPDTAGDREFIIGCSLCLIAKTESSAGPGAIQPILIGDTDSLIATCGLMKQCKEKLKTYLLRPHNRVAQFGVGVEDGGVKTYHTIQSLLPSFPWFRVGGTAGGKCSRGKCLRTWHSCSCLDDDGGGVVGPVTVVVSLGVAD